MNNNAFYTMNKNDLWKMYQWVLKRMTEEEVRIIKATRPNLLTATEREYGVGLKAKLSLIMETLSENQTHSRS